MSYVNFTELFDFDFNYVNQRDMPNIDHWLWNTDLDTVSLEQIPGYQLLDCISLNVFDFTENYANPKSLVRLTLMLQKFKIKHIILSSVTDTCCKNIYYFPTFYFMGVDRWKNLWIPAATDEKKYNISCLNRGAHGHRIHNLVRLMDHQYPRVLISWYDHHGEYDTEITEDIRQKYNQLKIQGIIPVVDSSPLTGGTVNTIQHDAYQSSYINVITESTVNDHVFISEKTWKPIASGQLFFMSGSLGTMSYLRELGVDLFDDIIDHSYDLEANWVARIDRMHQSLHDLMQQDLPRIQAHTEQRRRRNQEKFFSGIFGINYLQQINASAKSLEKVS